MLKVQGGEEATESENGILAHRTISERVVQAIIGGGLIYAGTIATDGTVKAILFVAGILVVVHVILVK